MKNDKFEGIITKAVGGNYYVAVSDGVLCCNARGLFRKEKISPCAGDNVIVSVTENSVPLICDIKERKNHIIRPPLANLDCALLVTSAVDPVPNTLVTDKLISIFESKHIEPVIVITKQDLRDCEEFAQIYRSCGFKVFYMDNPTGKGIDEIKSYVSGKLSALIGNSGVGKSSLMNHLFPGLMADTGDISKKLGRGRHTTRHTELFALPEGGFVADTPGFSTFDAVRMEKLTRENLQHYFPELEPYFARCRFSDCRHIKEPGCLVREAVERGDIARSRYESYCKLYEEVAAQKLWR